MRIDLALKYLCVIKSRSRVRTLCDKKAITVNGRPVKASSTLRVRDEIRISFPTGTLTLRLLSVPEKQLSKAAAPGYYQLIERTRTGEAPPDD